ncbi:restriction endonuclease type II-like protein [Scleroderma yunnanense]
MSTNPNPPVVQPGAGNTIIINPNQRLNPVLNCIRNVGKEFGDIIPDYQVGRTTCILFLSLKYHRLHPEYIHMRITKLGRSYNLRILLIMCDVTEHQELIRELTKVCLINNITIIVAWSIEEAGQYITTFKQFEHKPPDLIKERVDKDYASTLQTALTSINKVNKTDVETLRTSLGSFADIAKASSDRLQNLPGFGQVKVKRVKEAFEKPFRNAVTNATFSLGSQVTAVPSGAGDVDTMVTNPGPR